MAWHKFNIYIIVSLIISFGSIAVFIIGANPYRNIPFMDNSSAPLFGRDQRYTHPSVARDLQFDSAVFGTSTARLLNPVELKHDVGGGFANLALNSGTAYAQLRIAQLFFKGRKSQPMRTIIWGIDQFAWCQQDIDYTSPFPPWMYDDNQWNDLLHLFDSETLETSRRKMLYRLGLRDKYKQPNGYDNFLPDASEYDLTRAQEKLYQGKAPSIKKAQIPPAAISPSDKEDWTFATHELLKESLSLVPKETQKIIFFVPYHHFRQPAGNTVAAAALKECKNRIVKIASHYENVIILDFMKHSSITLNDENYWDPLHYTVVIASRLSQQIGAYINGRQQNKVDYDILYDNRMRK